MNQLDLVIKRKCPACQWETILTPNKPHNPPAEGLVMHDGSTLELRVDLRFI